MEEKRRYVRLDASVEVTWQKIADSSQQASPEDDITRNISEGGICLIVYEQISVGDVLDLVIELPTQKIIHSRGAVRWAKEFEIVGERAIRRYDIGLEFVNISDQDRQEIKKFVFGFLPLKDRK
jgi:c-di-GMP-binding flagellar brake protein YcgR